MLAEIWIVGDSIVRWAEARATERGTPTLTAAGISLNWNGRSSMSTLDLHGVLQFGLLQGLSPSMIVMHLGGNDIDNSNTCKIIKHLKANVRYLFCNFPQALIVWTYILPRFQWRNTDNSEESLLKMDKKRKRINRQIKEWVLSWPNGRVILHKDITCDTPGFFLPDGVHLSDIGNDMYLLTLQDAITSFLTDPTIQVAGI
ncbi:MAG: SGNH/GDSL hydrolase family protein [Candidatus Thiodiazotropha sp.]